MLTYPSPQAVAAAAAARLLDRIAAAQQTRGSAHLVLTGGGLGIATLEQVRRSDRRTDVDWAQVEIWWGDERWVEPDSPERNDVQARGALLDHVPVDPSRVHAMGHVGNSTSPEQAAETYAGELAAATQGQLVPTFDVLMLGMGGEGHVASIFPDSPAAHSDLPVVGVRDCPKPPPLRVSLGFTALQAANEVWLLVSGQPKADATARALTGATQVTIPAAGARGRQHTLWMLDEGAACALPQNLRST